MPNSRRPLIALRIDGQPRNVPHRIPERLCRVIDARAASTLSAWLRAAASQRLEQEQGIDLPMRQLLDEHDRQLRGLGINLNQLAHAANEGRPVVVNRQMLAEIQAPSCARRARCSPRSRSGCRSDRAARRWNRWRKAAMSANAEGLLDDYWFVLAPPGRARGFGGGAERPAAPAMRGSLLNAVRRKPQVMVKITSFAKSREGLAAHLDYISRNGQNEVFDPTGERFSAIGDAMNLSAREALQHYGRELAAGPFEETNIGRKKTGRSRKRVSMNLMLSMPAGTETGAFELAVREFLSEQFQAHDHLFTFHDDRDHYHAHVVVGLQGQDGRWLNPRKNDLLAWRQSFAASLERHGIAAEATPAYSRGNGKHGFRRDLEELRRRGTRERPDPSPSYEAETEERAIRRRAEAWTRIAAHYAADGDREAAEAIRDYVADHYDHHPSPAPPKNRRQGRPRPPINANAPATEGRER